MLPATTTIDPTTRRNYHRVTHKRPKNFEPIPAFPEDYWDVKRAGHKRCQGWSRQNGHQCTNLPIIGRDYCRFHGGRTLTGRANPAYKTGRWSKSLPTNLRAKYEEAMADPDLFSLKPAIALLDARLSELYEGLNDKGGNWQVVERSFADLVAAMKQGDSELVKRNLSALQEAIHEHKVEVQIWDEVHRTLEQQRKTVDTERKRYMDIMKVMGINEVIQLLNAVSNELAEVVQLNVEQDKARVIITESTRRIQKYLTRGD